MTDCRKGTGSVPRPGGPGLTFKPSSCSPGERVMERHGHRKRSSVTTVLHGLCCRPFVPSEAGKDIVDVSPTCFSAGEQQIHRANVHCWGGGPFSAPVRSVDTLTQVPKAWTELHTVLYMSSYPDIWRNASNLANACAPASSFTHWYPEHSVCIVSSSKRWQD